MQKHYSISLILVTSGEAGSQAFMGNRKVYQEAFLTNRTIDTTGAGDTFLGCCLAYILEQGMELSDHQLQEMLFRANAAASLETTRKGAIRAMPTQAELEDYLKQLTSFNLNNRRLHYERYNEGSRYERHWSNGLYKQRYSSAQRQ